MPFWRSPARLALARLVLPITLAACGARDGTARDGGSDGGRAFDAAPCEGLACAQVECDDTTTSVSGIVYAPNGVLPLPNVTIYVPNAPVDAFRDGARCDQCRNGLSGSPLVATTSDTRGAFTLENVPAAEDVPLVLQVGKWRRQIVLPRVTGCANTPLTRAQTRMPRTRSEGDLPHIALTTGGSDALECLLRKIGIDDDELGVAGSPARIHLYAGSGGTRRLDPGFAGGGELPDATALWSDLAQLSAYDLVILSCEGGAYPETKPASALAAMKAYADLGGRVFASHLHNYWLEAGPRPWPDVLEVHDGLRDLGALVADVNTAFPRGAELSSWLVQVGASPVRGKIDISDAQHTVTAVDESLADRWIYTDLTENDVPSVQYVSFTTPLEVEERDRCGRVVFSDIHVASGDDSAAVLSFPSEGCVTDVAELSPQEKVLAFMLFDIASCIGPPVD